MSGPRRVAAAGPAHRRRREAVRACCGGRRSPGGDRAARPAPPSRFFFRYTGHAPLTVAGPVSGKYYRFPAHGTTVEADARDAPSLGLVPELRRV